VVSDLEQRRLKVVRDHMHLEIVHDWEGVLATFEHPHYDINDGMAVFDGRDAVLRYFAASRTPFPDQGNEVISIAADGGDRVLVEFWLTGTHLGPLRRGDPGGYRRYDWHAGRLAEHHQVVPVDIPVGEGVGSGGAGFADAITTLVWVSAPRALRLRRGLARDGEGLRARWLDWLDEEQAHFARERTDERADVLVDGTGATAPVLSP